MSHDQQYPTDIANILKTRGVPAGDLIRLETTTNKLPLSALWVVRTAAYIDSDALRGHVPADEFDRTRALIGANAIEGTRGAICEVRSYMWFARAGRTLEDFYWDCGAQSADLECAGGRLLDLLNTGVLPRGGVPHIIILDSVEVATAFRGYGIGVTTAARSLEIAIAGADDVVIAAIAGARCEHERADITQRAALLLAGLGMTPMMSRVGEVWIDDIQPRGDAV